MTRLAVPPLDDARLAARARGTPFLVLLDVDGTLAPIAPRPEDAEVPEPARRAVGRLVGCAGVQVALVSGRAAADARAMVDVPGLWVVGNHGAETIAPDGSATVDAGVAAAAPALAAAAAELAAATAGVSGVLVEDKRWSLSIHLRLAPPELVASITALVEATAARHRLRLGQGKAVLELRAPVEVHKGTASRALAERLGATAPGASLLFVGDDVTDEDAFRTLRTIAPEALTVRVTGGDGAATTEAAQLLPPPPETAAEFVIPGPAAVRRLLEQLASLRGG